MPPLLPGHTFLILLYTHQLCPNCASLYTSPLFFYPFSPTHYITSLFYWEKKPSRSSCENLNFSFCHLQFYFHFFTSDLSVSFGEMSLPLADCQSFYLSFKSHPLLKDFVLLYLKTVFSGFCRYLQNHLQDLLKQISGLHSQRFWFSGSGMGPENLHF